MNYRTNITTTTEEKRNQIKGRLDDFATFVWRGDNAFDICGAFIIADKQGDLKFYNGPSFSNEYTKPQFSSSSGNLTGVSFNRQQVQFKMGAYWFSIEEWQNFIEWVNAYEVNYLTFSHSPDYGYLVKLAKIADSPRYIVGYENGSPRYYTEIDLTWDLQGDNCVRANLPYEWKWENNYFYLDSSKGPIKESRLETPLLLTLPLDVQSTNCKILFEVSHLSKRKTLFEVSIDNLPINEEPWLQYKVRSNLTSGEYSKANEGFYIASPDGKIWSQFKIRVSQDKNDVVTTIVILSNEENEEETFDSDTIFKIQNPTKSIETYFVRYEGLVDDLLTGDYFFTYPTIRYDSETGVLLYVVGDSSFKLLHLSLIDANGNYMVSSLKTEKYKLKNNIKDFHFYLTVNGAKIPSTPFLQIYERTNVI